MKKNVIALLLAVVMASGSIGTAPVMAAETTTQEAEQVQDEAEVAVEEEEAESENEAEDTSIAEEASEEESAEVAEEVPVQEEEETVEETEQTEEQEGVEEDATIEEDAFVEEESLTEDEVEGADEDQGKETDELKPEDIRVKDTEVKDTSTLQKEGEAADVVDSGTCGDNAIWTLTGTDNDLTLTISGSGDMEDNYIDNDAPWELKKNEITTLIIDEGITGISAGAFYDCINLNSVTLPDSITRIGLGWGGELI